MEIEKGEFIHTTVDLDLGSGDSAAPMSPLRDKGVYYDDLEDSDHDQDQSSSHKVRDDEDYDL